MTKRNANSVQNKVLASMQGRRVRIRLVGNAVIFGELGAADMFTLAVVADGDALATLIYKHAIATIKNVDETDKE